MKFEASQFNQCLNWDVEGVSIDNSEIDIRPKIAKRSWQKHMSPSVDSREMSGSYGDHGGVADTEKRRVVLKSLWEVHLFWGVAFSDLADTVKCVQR